MNSSSLPPASEGTEEVTRENDCSVDLDDIQETAVSLWVLEQFVAHWRRCRTLRQACPIGRTIAV
jgi:hypothetical protein